MDEPVVAEPEKQGLSNTAELTRVEITETMAAGTRSAWIQARRNPSAGEEDTNPSLTQSDLQWISAHQEKISFLQQSVTGYTNHT